MATKSPNGLRSDLRESSFQEREAVGTLHAHALYYCHLVISLQEIVVLLLLREQRKVTKQRTKLQKCMPKSTHRGMNYLSTSTAVRGRHFVGPFLLCKRVRLLLSPGSRSMEELPASYNLFTCTSITVLPSIC